MKKKKGATKSVPSINLKLSEELKNRVEKSAQFKKQTISKFTRVLLTSYIEGTLCDKEIAYYREKEFISSTSFLQLVVWMYKKKEDKSCTSTVKQLEDYIRTLKQTDNHLPEDLVQEFDKVLEDLIRVKNGKLPFEREFKFSISSYSNPCFNYEKLEYYLLDTTKTYHTIHV